MLGFGGQTALNCGVELATQKVLDKYDVKVLGTPIWGIEATEDRALFKKTMLNTGIPVPESKPAYSVDEARGIAEKIGYPVIMRVAYTLGGRGGGVAFNEYELDEIAQRGLASSLTHQILVEEYVGEWKQIEYEVMRDSAGNGLTVCNMENVLGMRVHTGDNIVVSPSQTLSNSEYHMLRRVSIDASAACGIIGECNIQFALDSHSEKYYAIEINARLSRSSALASKATGYPLAYIAAKLALGFHLPELLNKVTGVTTACFEPSLDYVVVKFPRWDLLKFERASRRIGSQMKSVGEVMAVGRCFEEALQKAVRMLDIGREGLLANDDSEEALEENIEEWLTHPTDEILFHIAKALDTGMTVEKVSEIASVDPWFVGKINNVVQLEKELKKRRKQVLSGGETELLRETKRLGFSDSRIAQCIGTTGDDVRKIRISSGIIPCVKQIDTLAAEWPAQTNYLYLTYGDSEDDVTFKGGKKAVVLGAGTYRIGSSVEFDWSTMHMVWALKSLSFDEVIVVNCNPETVSTDYDMSDKLYFEELTLERILDIYEKENPLGVVTSVGGQIPNSVAPKLAARGVRLLGSDSSSIDRAEDRSKFSSLLDSLRIPQPPWSIFDSVEEARRFARSVGYPVLVRPSYVLSGASMRVVWTSSQMERFLAMAAKVSPEYPVVISKFIRDALEVEVDAVGDGEDVYIGSIIEHVDKAGVHSGDAVMVIPPQTLSSEVKNTLVDYTGRIAKALSAKGPFNIQFVVKDGQVYVIECNLRASRSMPFVSKVMEVDLIGISASAIVEGKMPVEREPVRSSVRIGVKVPQFSFMQLEGADPHLGVEMQSTGEVACISDEFNDALIKAFQAAGYRLPREGGNILVTVGGSEMKRKTLPLIRRLRSLGYNIFATEHTAEYLAERAIKGVSTLYKMAEETRKPNLKDYLVERKLDLIINIPSATILEKYAQMLEDEYLMRRKAVELGIPVLTTYETSKVFVDALVGLRRRKRPDEDHFFPVVR